MTGRHRGEAGRERLWADMAGAAAQQLVGPLSSIDGWIEFLQERSHNDPGTLAMVAHMRAELDRLELVAHRVKAIGRMGSRDVVNIVTAADRVAAHFHALVPTLAHTYVIDVSHADAELTTVGDAVLVEWILELLVQNALDALDGRGGRIAVSTARLPGGGCRIRVTDDGAVRPIGDSLATRLVEVDLAGTLTHVPSDQGSTFDVIFP